jgi:hypothetical protein
MMMMLAEEVFSQQIQLLENKGQSEELAPGL